MAEKKIGLGGALLFGTAAAVIGGLVAYYKKDEITKLADELKKKMETAENELADLMDDLEEEADLVLQADEEITGKIGDTLEESFADEDDFAEKAESKDDC